MAIAVTSVGFLSIKWKDIMLVSVGMVTICGFCS